LRHLALATVRLSNVYSDIWRLILKKLQA